GRPDQDGDRFVEIWNLVFMQFEQLPGGERADLPRPSIDTGMGLERIAAVLQGKHDNYDIDLFRALITASAEASGFAPDGPHAVSHRVIADHLRASSFLIADGVLPSKEGSGDVLRRIMRRAMRPAHLPGCQDPVAPGLVPAFVPYDTYGFPLELTEDILRGHGMRVDTAGFDREMGEARQRSRASWVGSGEAATETAWFALRDELGATEFLGYETETAEGVILALVKGEERVPKAQSGEEIGLIVNQTPFYGEAGGQVGDTGAIFSATGGEFAVSDTQRKAGDLFVHFGRITHGALRVGDAVELRVEGERRRKLRANHSVTHLLHQALRHRLGEHVTQKGSLV